MENSSAEFVPDKKINGSENKDVNSKVKADPKLGTGVAEDPIHGHMTPRKEGAPWLLNPSEEVDMEATITSEDVMRAGGFGARDDIGSVLPVASDATDFEETLLDARDYEEPQAEGGTRRPGLGWTDAAGTPTPSD